jgi:hypothetical protein
VADPPTAAIFATSDSSPTLEQQEQHAELRHGLDHGQRAQHVEAVEAHEAEIAEHDAREQLAEHRGQPEPLEQCTAQSREHEDQRERFEHGQHVDRAWAASSSQGGVGAEQAECEHRPQQAKS